MTLPTDTLSREPGGSAALHTCSAPTIKRPGGTPHPRTWRGPGPRTGQSGYTRLRS